MLKAISPKQLGWEPYINLVWLVFIFFPPLFNDSSTYRDWLLVALIVTCFLPIYLWTYSQKSPRGSWGLALLLLLGFVFCPFNGGASTFFIYAASLAGYYFRWQVALGWVAASFILGLISAWLSPIPFPYNIFNFLPSLLLTLIIGGYSVFHAEQNRTEVKLNMANEEIGHLATIAERERIARDLHDLLGHTLSVIALKSELANKLLEKNPSQAKQEMLEVERISRETLSEVRSAVTGYRSKGLTAEIAHAKLALESAGVSFAYQNSTVQLTPLQESTLSLIVREAVTNIIRHAKATRCTISLSEDDNELKLEIADNGQGLKSEEGSGLSGMRERVQALGGAFVLENRSGVRLHVTLPKVERANQLVSISASQLNLKA
jgi:two-component system, NarL family, sensor histidine kinase DesK